MHCLAQPAWAALAPLAPHFSSETQPVQDAAMETAANTSAASTTIAILFLSRLLVASLFQCNPNYISRRFSRDLERVTSSANSRSLPTGMPMAMRVTLMPRGLISLER